jgi:hypothetical protein
LSWLEWGGDGFWLIWILGGTKEPVEEAWFWLFVLGISLPKGGFGIILGFFGSERVINSLDVGHPFDKGVTGNTEIGGSIFVWGLERNITHHVVWSGQIWGSSFKINDYTSSSGGEWWVV